MRQWYKLLLRQDDVLSMDVQKCDIIERMTTDPNNTNPYCSPLASGVSTEPRCRRFPWRIVPVVLLYLYGGLAVLSGVVFAFLVQPGGVGMLIGDPQHPHYVYVMSNAQRCLAAFGWGLFGLHGCFAIAAARYLWKQRWWRSVAAIAAAIVLVILVYVTFCNVHRLPPGRQLVPTPPSSEATDN
jgi:hypothetical protein